MTGCVCIDIDFGSYEAEEIVVFPFATRRFPVPRTKRVGIDRCLLDDIRALWGVGIETVASCCGHGRVPGSIVVKREHVPLMGESGYARDPRWPHLPAFRWPAGPIPETEAEAPTGASASRNSPVSAGDPAAGDARSSMKEPTP